MRAVSDLYCKDAADDDDDDVINSIFICRYFSGQFSQCKENERDRCLIPLTIFFSWIWITNSFEKEEGEEKICLMYRVYKCLLLLWWSSSERWPIKIWFGFIVVRASASMAVFCSFPSSFSFFLHMNAYWNSTLLFFHPISFLFSSFSLKTNTHTRFCISWRFRFVHISSTWFCPYLVWFLSHRHNRNAHTFNGDNCSSHRRKSFFFSTSLYSDIKNDSWP